MQDLSGTDIKGYKLVERIGAGGFGAVYKAQQTTVGREVAMKIILPGFASQPDFIRRFESEAQLVARLEHLHIVPLYDYWRDPDGAYLVMRYLKGGSLYEALKNGAFDLRAVALVLDQVASALDVAHRNDVIHRDIKPGNILLDEDGNAYLADFGIAKDLVKEGITQPDSVIGSLDYISPEQARNDPVTPRTDIYSLGVTLYEMLTGEHPFKGASSVERLYKHLSDPLPEIATLDPAVRDTINDVIQCATAKDPSQRYPDVLALAAAFREGANLNAARRADNLVEQLTLREQEILQLIIQGYSNKQIADKLFVTLATVKWHIAQLYAKLGVRSRVQAIVRARELDLIVTGDTSENGRGLDGQLSPSVMLPEPENPYKGLRAFQSGDARDFFGREELVDKLVKRLGESERFGRFLAVVGPSGSGKSSVVKAGLIPALWQGKLPDSERWFIAEMLPGTHPLDKLEVALTRIAANQSSNLNEHLQRDERGLLRIADLILPDDGSELVVVIDQFEEVFTLVETEAARVHFLNLIQAAVSDARSRVRVIVTLRADYYDRPLHYPEFGEMLRSRMETVLPLGAKALERAVSEPAQRAGMTFEPGLVAQIVSETNYQTGALPLLQYALTELFERRRGRLMTHDAYREIGGAGGALAHRADELYLSLDEGGQELARQMFLRLVTLGEGAEDTRRRVTSSELLAISSDTDLMDEIIDTFAAYRLLSLDNDPASHAPTVEVAHEAILREWERLRKWLNDSRDDIRSQRQLAGMAADWRSSQQDASYLARGSRLEHFEKWAKDTELALTPGERAYLDASLSHRAKELTVEAERQAREARLEQRSRNFLRGLVAVLLLATLGAFGLTGVAINQSNIARAERDNAQNLALVSGSQAALANGNTDLAIALALEANRTNHPTDNAQFTLAEAAYAPGTIRRFEGHKDAVASVAFSPDGHMALSSTGSNDLLPSVSNVEIILWDVKTGTEIRRFGANGKGHSADVNSVAFSPDGHIAVSASADKTVILWDVATGNILHRLEGHSAAVGAAIFSPDGQTVLSGSYDHTLILWDAKTGTVLRTFQGHTQSVRSVAFSPDGLTVISAAGEGAGAGELILWDVETGKEIRRFEGHSERINAVAFSPDGHTALSGSGGNLGETQLILWNVETGQEIRRFYGHSLQIYSVAFSPDGKTAVSGGQDTTLILWNLQTGEQIQRLRGHSGVILSVAFSPDGQTILSGSQDKTLRLWSLDTGSVIRRFAGHNDWVWNVALSPDGKMALSGAGDGTMTLWDVQTGEAIHNFPKQSGWVTTVAFSPNGRTFLSGHANLDAADSGEIILWDIATGQEIRRIETDTPIKNLIFTPDGQSFLSGAFNDKATIILWDVETGHEIRRFVGHTDVVLYLAISPDGHQALSGSYDNSLILWNLDTGEVIHRFTGHSAPVWGVAFSPDGRTALSSSADNIIILWDLETGKEIRRFLGHSGPVAVGGFSRDGLTFISASGDKTVKLWDVTTGATLRSFEGPASSGGNVVFSPDNRAALAGYADGNVILWRIDTLDELVTWTHANRYIPDLTCDQRALYRLEPLCDANGVVPAQPGG